MTALKKSQIEILAAIAKSQDICIEIATDKMVIRINPKEIETKPGERINPWDAANLS